MIKRRLLVVIVVILSLAFLMSSCNMQKNIPVSFYTDYKSEILKNSSVKDIYLRFSRPSLWIEVQVSDSISDDEITKIFESTKSYVTVDNMNVIGKYVKWNAAISYVYLEIRNSSEGTLLKQYEAHYFKTYNASDNSPENIDGYKTWWEETIKE